jgi:hypothetical protein
MSDQCRSCGAEVIFMPSAKSGKRMILDAKPEKRIVLGNTIEIPAAGDSITGFLLGPAEFPLVARVVDTYVDHHATCPSAGQWKGRTR